MASSNFVHAFVASNKPDTRAEILYQTIKHADVLQLTLNYNVLVCMHYKLTITEDEGMMITISQSLNMLRFKLTQGAGLGLYYTSNIPYLKVDISLLFAID